MKNMVLDYSCRYCHKLFMKVKKIFASLIVLGICLFAFGCEPMRPYIYTVGDTQTTLDGCDIKLVCADYETDGETATIRLTMKSFF